jgi:uncharacterized membrane protein YeaQ/YmgE (transglycosylase-associated protein family)
MDNKDSEEKDKKVKSIENAGLAGGSSVIADEYIGNIDGAISKANQANRNVIHTKSGAINQSNNLDGFIAEQHHANTFNIDSKAQSKSYHADALQPAPGKTYQKNSVDIVIKDDKTGKIVRRYQSKYGKDATSTEKLFDHGDYRGQQKLVPEGQSANIGKKSTEVIEYDGVKSKSISKSDVKEQQNRAQEKGSSKRHNWEKDVNSKSIVKGIHKEAANSAAIGAGISGGISLVSNIVAIAKGEKEPDEALLSVLKDTGTGAAVGYGTTFLATGIQAIAKKSGNVIAKSLSKTALPAQIVTIALETGKTLYKYTKGEIDGIECIRELGEKGTGMIGGVYLGLAGEVFGKALEKALKAVISTAIPIPLIGSIVGSMVGYALGSVMYASLLESAQTLKDAKLAHEERVRIEAECAEAVRMIRGYRIEMEKYVSEYLVDHITVFRESFDGIKNALGIGDVDGFISNANEITKKLGKTPKFNNFSEFDSLMNDSESLSL